MLSHFLRFKKGIFIWFLHDCDGTGRLNITCSYHTRARDTRSNILYDIKFIQRLIWRRGSNDEIRRPIYLSKASLSPRFWETVNHTHITKATVLFNSKSSYLMCGFSSLVEQLETNSFYTELCPSAEKVIRRQIFFLPFTDQSYWAPEVKTGTCKSS